MAIEGMAQFVVRNTVLLIGNTIAIYLVTVTATRWKHEVIIKTNVPSKVNIHTGH